MGTARKRIRPAKASYLDGALALAVNGLFGAVGAMINPRPYPRRSGGYDWTDSRYEMLREGIGSAMISGHGRHSASLIPANIDYLKLGITIDTRTAELSPKPGDTIVRLRRLTEAKYRPQDADHLQDVSAEIKSWARAIDDLMATKPLYLPDPCPHCGHTHAYRQADDGQRIRTPALALSIEAGAWCQNCHDVWPPEHLGILARLLGYHPVPGVCIA